MNKADHERNRVAAQAKFDRASPEEKQAMLEDAEERRALLPWHPSHGNAPQHSMSDTATPVVKNRHDF